MFPWPELIPPIPRLWATKPEDLAESQILLAKLFKEYTEPMMGAAAGQCIMRVSMRDGGITVEVIPPEDWLAEPTAPTSPTTERTG